jgi:hypothetical protein
MIGTSVWIFRVLEKLKNQRSKMMSGDPYLKPETSDREMSQLTGNHCA